eukprot:gene4927-3538_t
MIAKNPSLEIKGIEMSVFRRNMVRRAQRAATLGIILLSNVSLLFVLVSCSMDQVVQFSVNGNVVFHSVVLIPKTAAEVGFARSCIAYQCYRRSDVGVPPLLARPEKLIEMMQMDNYALHSYAEAMNFFNIGYNFAVSCGTDSRVEAPRSISRLVLASHILLIVCLTVIFIGAAVLFRQLGDEAGLYHNLSRKHLIYHPGASRAYLEDVVSRIVHECRVSWCTMRLFLLCGFLSFAFALCALCGSLAIIWRPGCSQGFCSAFNAKITQLAQQLAVDPVGSSCGFGISVYLCIAFFTLVTVLFLTIVGFFVHVWMDDRRRKVDEAISYLMELRMSVQEEPPSAGQRVSYGEETNSIMARIAMEKRGEDQRLERSLFRSEEAPPVLPLVRQLSPVPLMGRRSVSEPRRTHALPRMSLSETSAHAALLSVVSEEAAARELLEEKYRRRWMRRQRPLRIDVDGGKEKISTMGHDCRLAAEGGGQEKDALLRTTVLLDREYGLNTAASLWIQRYDSFLNTLIVFFFFFFFFFYRGTQKMTTQMNPYIISCLCLRCCAMCDLDMFRLPRMRNEFNFLGCFLSIDNIFLDTTYAYARIAAYSSAALCNFFFNIIIIRSKVSVLAQDQEERENEEYARKHHLHALFAEFAAHLKEKEPATEQDAERLLLDLLAHRKGERDRAALRLRYQQSFEVNLENGKKQMRLVLGADGGTLTVTTKGRNEITHSFTVTIEQIEELNEHLYELGRFIVDSSKGEMGGLVTVDESEVYFLSGSRECLDIGDELIHFSLFLSCHRYGAVGDQGVLALITTEGPLSAQGYSSLPANRHPQQHMKTKQKHRVQSLSFSFTSFGYTCVPGNNFLSTSLQGTTSPFYPTTFLPQSPIIPFFPPLSLSFLLLGLPFSSLPLPFTAFSFPSLSIGI